MKDQPPTRYASIGWEGSILPPVSTIILPLFVTLSLLSTLAPCTYATKGVCDIDCTTCPPWVSTCSMFEGRVVKNSTVEHPRIAALLREVRPPKCLLEGEAESDATADCVIRHAEMLPRIQLYDGSIHVIDHLRIVHAQTINNTSHCLSPAFVKGERLACEVLLAELTKGNFVAVKAFGMASTNVFYPADRQKTPCRNCSVSCTVDGYVVRTEASISMAELCINKRTNPQCHRVETDMSHHQAMMPWSAFYDTSLRNGSHLMELNLWHSGNFLERIVQQCVPCFDDCQQDHRDIVVEATCEMTNFWVTPECSPKKAVVVFVVASAVIATLAIVTLTACVVLLVRRLKRSSLPDVNRFARPETCPDRRSVRTPPRPPRRIASTNSSNETPDVYAPILKKGRSTATSTTYDLPPSSVEYDSPPASNENPFYDLPADGNDRGSYLEPKQIASKPSPETPHVISETRERSKTYIELRDFNRAFPSISVKPLNASVFLALLGILAIRTSVEACVETVSFVAKEHLCSESPKGNSTCRFDHTTVLNLRPSGLTSCIQLWHAKMRPYGVAELKINQATVKCQRIPKYFTRPFEMTVASSKRCWLAGSCSNRETCGRVGPTDYVEELKEFHKFPGHTRCEDSPGCAVNFCFLCIPACLFSRAYAYPSGHEVGEIYTCDWSTRITVDITLRHANNVTESEVLSLSLDEPSATWKNIRINLNSLGVNPGIFSPETRFVTDGNRVAVLPFNFEPYLRCNSSEEARAFNCTLKQGLCECRGASGVEHCDCPPDPSAFKYLKDSAHTLPLKAGSYDLIPKGGTITGRIVSSLVQLQVTVKGLETSLTVTDARCRMLSTRLTGCAECLEAATLQYQCSTDIGSALGHVHCHSARFTVNCDSYGNHKKVVLHLSSREVDEQCTLTCVSSVSHFTLRGRLAMGAMEVTSVELIGTHGNYSTGFDIAQVGQYLNNLSNFVLTSVFNPEIIVTIILTVLALIIAATVIYLGIRRCLVSNLLLIVILITVLTVPHVSANMREEHPKILAPDDEVDLTDSLMVLYGEEQGEESGGPPPLLDDYLSSDEDEGNAAQLEDDDALNERPEAEGPVPANDSGAEELQDDVEVNVIICHQFDDDFDNLRFKWMYFLGPPSCFAPPRHLPPTAFDDSVWAHELLYERTGFVEMKMSRAREEYVEEFHDFLRGHWVYVPCLGTYAKIKGLAYHPPSWYRLGAHVDVAPWNPEEITFWDLFEWKLIGPQHPDGFMAITTQGLWPLEALVVTAEKLTPSQLLVEGLADEEVERIKRRSEKRQPSEPIDDDCIPPKRASPERNCTQDVTGPTEEHATVEHTNAYNNTDNDRRATPPPPKVKSTIAVVSKTTDSKRDEKKNTRRTYYSSREQDHDHRRRQASIGRRSEQQEPQRERAGPSDLSRRTRSMRENAPPHRSTPHRPVRDPRTLFFCWSCECRHRHYDCNDGACRGECCPNRNVFRE